MSAIEKIDTQVARRGRQYHHNPPSYQNCPTKKTALQKATVLQKYKSNRLQKYKATILATVPRKYNKKNIKLAKKISNQSKRAKTVKKKRIQIKVKKKANPKRNQSKKKKKSKSK